MSANLKSVTSAALIATGLLVGAAAASGADACETCPGDADGDCRVGFLDLAITLGAWGPCLDCENCPADHDGDCDVDVDDLLIVLPNWGPCERVLFARHRLPCGGQLVDWVETKTDSDYVTWDATIKWRGVSSAGNAIARIEQRKAEFGREISVLLVSYGCEGVFSLGSGSKQGHDEIGPTANELTVNNAAWFGEQIKDSVTRITLWGCQTGADQEFIDAMANDGLEVCAFTGHVTDTLIQWRPYYFAEYFYEAGTMICVP